MRGMELNLICVNVSALFIIKVYPDHVTKKLWVMEDFSETLGKHMSEKFLVIINPLTRQEHLSLMETVYFTEIRPMFSAPFSGSEWF